MAGDERAALDRRYLAMWFGAGAWGLLVLAPFYREPYRQALVTRLQSGSNLLFTFFAVQLLQVAELVLLSALLRAAVHAPLRRALRVPVLVVGLAIAATYHGLLYLSWAYHDATGEFLSRRVLALAPFVTADPRGFWGVLSAEDRGRLASAAIATLLACVVAVAASCAHPHRWSTRGRLRGAALAWFAAVAIGVGSFALLPLDGQSMAIQLLRYGASPSITSFWAPVVAPAPVVSLPRAHVDRFTRREIVPLGRRGPDAPDLYVFVVEALRSDVATAPEHAETTPYLHRLAQGRLSRPLAVAQAVETSESISVMLSGTYALRFEARDLRVDPRGRQSVLDLLREAGYRTAFLGEEWEIDRELTRRGVDFRLNPQAMRGEFTGDENDPWKTGVYVEIESDRLKLRRLIEWATRERAPVAAVTYLQAPHYPYQLPVGAEARYTPVEIGHDHSFLGYGKELYAVMWNRYRNVLVATDGLLASFVERIAAVRGGRPRVILVTGDHGESFGEHGAVTHARAILPEILAVPYLIDAPEGWAPAGAALPAHVDLFATLLTFAGLPIPPNQGDALVAREGDAVPAPKDRPVFATSQLYVSEDAIVSESALFTLSYDTLGTRLFDLASRQPIDARALARRLCACLLHHRAYQLRYYEPLRSLARSHAPMKWNDCTFVPEAVRECERIVK